MIFDDLQQELSEALAESSTKTFSLARRKKWLNDGVVDVCQRTLCLEKTATKNVLAATRIYKIKTDWGLSDFIEFSKQGLLYDDNNADPNARKFIQLHRKTVEWLDETVPFWRITGSNNQSDNPVYYARLGVEDVYTQPVPKTAVTNGWIINYYYYPIQGTTNGGMVNAGDIPFNAGTTDLVPWLVPFHNLPVLYAAYRALLKAGVPKKDAVLAEYSAGLKELRLVVHGGSPDYKPKLRVTNYRAR